MSEYLDEHLPLEFTIVYQEGSGNGDSFNHKVEFNAL